MAVTPAAGSNTPTERLLAWSRTTGARAAASHAPGRFGWPGGLAAGL